MPYSANKATYGITIDALAAAALVLDKRLDYESGYTIARLTTTVSDHLHS